MLFLDFLDRKFQTDRRVEYRLFCSGTLYREHSGDSTRSVGARLLATEPFELINASEPPDAYPQELVLRFDTGSASIRKGNAERQVVPDEEIAQDFCAILSLISRRLVTVGCKTNDFFTEESGLPVPLRSFPRPIWGCLNPVIWQERPADVIYGKNDTRIVFNDPPPVVINPSRLRAVLSSLPSLSEAKTFMRSCRLYWSALANIESRHELAYQMLISAIDNMAQAAFRNWPGDDERLSIKANQVQAAIEEGLELEAAKRLILKLSMDDRLNGRKFKKFLKDYVNREELDCEDDLFLHPPEFCPEVDQFDKAVSEIWKNRGGSLHGGREYPPTASVGTSNFVSQAAAFELSASIAQDKLPFPPVTWFERVVHSAIASWLFGQLPLSSEGNT